MCLVEYWRNRTQRMNKERFIAANMMALVTHTIVSASKTFTRSTCRFLISAIFFYRPNLWTW